MGRGQEKAQDTHTHTHAWEDRAGKRQEGGRERARTHAYQGGSTIRGEAGGGCGGRDAPAFDASKPGRSTEEAEALTPTPTCVRSISVVAQEPGSPGLARGWLGGLEG